MESGDTKATPTRKISHNGSPIKGLAKVMAVVSKEGGEAVAMEEAGEEEETEGHQMVSYSAPTAIAKTTRLIIVG